MKIACIQLNIKENNQELNLKTAEKLIIQASRKGAKIICLPELFSSGVTDKPINFININIKKYLSKLAIENKVHIIGTFLEKNKTNKFFNSLCHINKKGISTKSYKKIHVFTYHNEHDNYDCGEELLYSNIENIKCSFFICYDLRFPELFRIASLNGAKIIFVSANWPHPREDNWKTLVKARAIENQVFMVATNSVGNFNSKKYFGGSLIINPSGDVLAEGKKNKEEIIFADLDLNELNKIRTSFPVLKDRKKKLYELKWIK